MTTDDYTRLGLAEFLAGCHEEWNRNRPAVETTDPAAIALEVERQQIEDEHAQSKTAEGTPDGQTEGLADASRAA